MVHFSTEIESLKKPFMYWCSLKADVPLENPNMFKLLLCFADFLWNVCIQPNVRGEKNLSWGNPNGVKITSSELQPKQHTCYTRNCISVEVSRNGLVVFINLFELNYEEKKHCFDVIRRCSVRWSRGTVYSPDSDAGENLTCTSN